MHPIYLKNNNSAKFHPDRSLRNLQSAAHDKKNKNK